MKWIQHVSSSFKFIAFWEYKNNVGIKFLVGNIRCHSPCSYTYNIKLDTVYNTTNLNGESKRVRKNLQKNERHLNSALHPNIAQ